MFTARERGIFTFAFASQTPARKRDAKISANVSAELPTHASWSTLTWMPDLCKLLVLLISMLIMHWTQIKKFPTESGLIFSRNIGVQTKRSQNVMGWPRDWWLRLSSLMPQKSFMVHPVCKNDAKVRRKEASANVPWKVSPVSILVRLSGNFVFFFLNLWWSLLECTSKFCSSYCSRLSCLPKWFPRKIVKKWCVIRYWRGRCFTQDQFRQVTVHRNAERQLFGTPLVHLFLRFKKKEIALMSCSFQYALWKIDTTIIF